MLEIQLFGHLRASSAGRPVATQLAPRSRKLWAYLLLKRHGVLSRSAIAFSLWPDLPERRAMANLRQHLHRLRRALAESGEKGDWILAEESGLRWNPEAALLDLQRFESIVDQVRRAAAPPAAQVAEALHMSRAALLEDHWDDWAVSARQRVESRHQQLTHWLALQRLAAGELTAATDLARDLLNRDPISERWLRLLVGLLAVNGERAAALQHYKIFESRLNDELGAPPSEESQLMLRRLRAEQPDAQILDLIQRDGAAFGQPQAARQLDTGPATLPVFHGRLFGRADTLSVLEERLAQPGLTTLIGAPGVGTSRLAVELARRHAERSHLPCAYVDLALLHDPAALADRLRSALRLSGQDEAPSGRDALLVLDHCQAMPNAVAALMDRWLKPGCGLHVLATSSCVLGASMEQLFPIRPLPVPADSELEASDLGLADQPALALFEHRAGRRRPGFVLGAGQIEDALRICRAVAGLPLGIEQAADAISALGLPQIAERLEQGLELPHLGTAEVRGSQADPSLGRKLMQDCDALGEAERTLLRRLTVFRGGWTLEAAEDLGLDALRPDPDRPSTLQSLARLVDRSMILSQNQGGEQRYRMLRPLRLQIERHGIDSQAQGRLRAWHAAYYSEFAERALPHLTGPDQAQWLERLQAEEANLEAALSWQYATGDHAAAIALAGALWRFWYMRNRAAEGAAWLERLVMPPGPAAALEAVAQDKLARALHGAGALKLSLCEYEQAERLHRKELQVAEATEDAHLRADAHLGLGVVFQHRQRHALARKHYAASLRLWRHCAELRGQIIVRSNLGSLARDAGRPNEAKRQLNACLALNRHRLDAASYAHALWGLADLLFDQQDFDAAEAYYGQMQESFRALGEQRGEAFALQGLGRICLRSGAVQEAAGHLSQALRLISSAGDTLGTALLIEDLMQLEQRRRDMQRVLALAAAASKLREELDRPPSSRIKARIDRITARARRRLDAREATRQWLRGLDLSCTDILAWYVAPA